MRSVSFSNFGVQVLLSSHRPNRRVLTSRKFQKRIVCSQTLPLNMPLSHSNYEEFRKDESAFTCAHDYKIPDPYRWLEDPENPETKTFVDIQNSLVEPIVNGYRDKEKVEKRLTELYDFERYQCPMKRGNFYYYFYNTGLQNQPVLYRTSDLNEKGDVFLDPNTFSEDGTSSISTYTFSIEGDLFAYGVSEAGSDWVTIYVMDTNKCEQLSDKLERVKFTCLKFTKDAKGLFYNRYPVDGSEASGVSTSANKFHTVYYHRIGEAQSDDVTVAHFPNHEDYMGHVDVSKDGRYLFLNITESCDSKCLLWYYDLAASSYEVKAKLEWIKMFDTLEAEYQYIYNWDTQVILLTNKDAPKWRLVKVDLSDPSYTLVDVIPESKHVLDHVAPMADGSLFIVNYIIDVVDTLFIYDTKTWQVSKKLEMGISAVCGISTKDFSYELFFKVSTFVTPGTVYRVDLRDPEFKVELWREMKLKGVNQQDFVCTQVFYKSKDGTKVPMFINHKKSVDKSSGCNVVNLYGYGGFNIALGPTFSPFNVLFMQHFDGLFCQPNIRGGSEYGEDWHKGGQVLNKQNVFDDFIAAAEFLVREKYTRPDKIIMSGGSNGGLLTAACMLQRPDLFGVVLCQVGVLDMLRFHKFTIGAAWQSDYGYPDENKQHFDYLLKYSPLHNVRVPPNGQLPAYLGVTADHDDRVSPLHTLKFIATLQSEANKHKDRQTNPLMVLVDTKAGHGAGKPTTKVIEERTKMMAFCAQHLDLQFKEC